MLYYFKRADQMIGHDFTDDVAICRAFTKKQAIRKFEMLYKNIEEKEVDRIRRLFTKPRILTDY